MAHRKLAPTVCIADVLTSVDEKREDTSAAMSSNYEASSFWLKQEIESCKRKILSGMGNDNESKSKKSKDAVNVENQNKNISNAERAASASFKRTEKPQTHHELSELDVMSMKVVELQKELRGRGLEVTGLKKVLQKRLLSNINQKKEKKEEEIVKMKSKEAPKPKQETVVVADTEKANISQSDSNNSSNVADDGDVEMNDADSTERRNSVGDQMDVEEVVEEESAPETLAAPNKEAFISPESKPVTSPAGLSVDDSEVNDVVVPIVSNKTVSKSILKTAESLFSPKKTYVKPKPIVMPTSAKRMLPPSMTSAPIPSIPSQTVRTISQSDENSNSSKTSEESCAQNAEEMASSNKVTWNGLPKNTVPVLSTPAIVANKNLQGSSTKQSSTKAKQLALQEARKARIAEIRGKSKPVALGKINLPAKNLSAASKFVASSSNSADQEDKRKLLAAQMREKAAAALKKPVVAMPPAMSMAGSQMDKASKFEGSSSGQMNSSSFQPPADLAHSQHAIASAKKQNLPARPEIRSPMDTYEISDRDESDSEDESDYEDSQPKKKVPKWAQKNYLIPALEKQFAMTEKRFDPDTIFPEVQSCDLEAIFGDQKKQRYKKRTSSGNWTRDKVTVAEKLSYKRTMGYTAKA
mmetsp:Transcript_322/g.428  ORF Transcript_322/g.428 Transcript_322/m.428 type:complete len:640 (-) Transcript_322:118-2037(-)